jgi:MoaD family protein
MEIKLLLFGAFRDLAGQRQQVVSIQEGARLSDLLKQLSYKYGSDIQEEVKKTKWLRILINGREYNLINGMETVLKHQDEVIILPFLAGG